MRGLCAAFITSRCVSVLCVCVCVCARVRVCVNCQMFRHFWTGASLTRVVPARACFDLQVPGQMHARSCAML